MSFYTDGLKTHYIDPINHQPNVRSEFRLDPGKVYLTNLRIANLGGTDSSGNNSGVNDYSGVYGLIKNITLMNGGDTLSQFRDLNEYVVWNNLQHKNADNMNLTSELSGAQVGFHELNLQITGGGADNVQRVVYRPADNNKTYQNFKGWLGLSSCLPMLKNITYLPTNLFTDLKVVIEYNTNPKDTAKDKRFVLDNSSVKPVLIADEIVNPERKSQMMQSFPSFVWNEIESDRMIVEAKTMAGANAVNQQFVEKRLNGFNDKTVGRMLMVNKSPNDNVDLSGNAVIGGGTSGSLSMPNQKVNLRVNGIPMFSFDGVDNDGERLAYTADAYGDYNIGLGENITGLGNNISVDFDVNRRGRKDYFGVNLAGQKIRDLQITYQRQNATDTEDRYNSELTLFCFGEVQKELKVQGNNYVVGYV